MEQKIIEQKLTFANIPTEFKDLKVQEFDTEMYSVGQNQQLAQNVKHIAIQYVKQYAEWDRMGKGLYLYSGTKGSGKTRLVVSLGNALINVHKKSVRFITTISLLNEIKATYDGGSGTEKQLIEDMSNIDVLILDDLGVEKPSAWVQEVLYAILNDRMTAKRVTLFTSNCRVEELKLDDRLISRIKIMALPVKFPEESVRSKIAKSDNDYMMQKIMEE